MPRFDRRRRDDLVNLRREPPPRFRSRSPARSNWESGNPRVPRVDSYPLPGTLNRPARHSRERSPPGFSRHAQRSPPQAPLPLLLSQRQLPAASHPSESSRHASHVRHIGNLDHVIRTRNQRIRDLEGDVTKVSKEAKDLRLQRSRLERTQTAQAEEAKELRAEKKLLADKVEEVEALMRVGGKCLQEKALLIERLIGETQRVKQELLAREEEIRDWREKMEGAARMTAQEAVDVALDVQAKRSLGEIEELKEKVCGKDKALKMLREEIEELRKTKSKDREAAETEEVWRRLAEDQQMLINKLVREHARLGGEGKVA